MPDENGNLTAGDANVATPGPTPVAPDIGATPPVVPGAAPSIGERTASSLSTPARPPQAQPSFFRQLLFSLGKGLIEGTKAGLQAPLGPQGPSIAAQTAIQAPQKAREQLTTNQMNDLNVAMSQLKLHQLQMVTNQMEEDQQNAVYDRGQKTLAEFIDKGKAEVLATGDLKSVQDEFARRQADAKQAGQGLLPLQVLPAAGSSAKDPQYSLVSVGKERLTDDMDETWGASDLGISDKDFKDAGLVPFKFHASQGMDTQKALQLKTTQYLNWITKSSNQLGQLKRERETQAGATGRAQLGADVRLKVAELNNLTRRAIADQKIAQDAGDKQKVQALGKLVTAAKAFGDAQGKIGNKAWDVLTGAETKELQTKRAALDAAKAEYDAVSQKPKITVTGAPGTKVPKGTKATGDIIRQYGQKNGGDVAATRRALLADGYTIPGKGQTQ